jgi:CheY-like chemotaxis protein
MVYGTVRQLGGMVRLESRPGEGTTATMLIPRAAAQKRQQVAPTIPAPTKSGRRVKVLLTDDDHDVRRFTAEALAELGYQVVEAASGPSGLQLIEQDRDIALLIVDLAMPGMSGPDMIERCRSLRPHLPIVVFTGYAEISEALWGLPVVRKPASAEALAEAIEQSLAPREAEIASVATG